MHKFFLEMNTKHILKDNLKDNFVFPKTCPKTITLTFPPLIYTVMFQNLLSKIIKNEILFTFSNAHSLNVFLQSHIIMQDYPLYANGCCQCCGIHLNVDKAQVRLALAKSKTLVLFFFSKFSLVRYDFILQIRMS